MFLHESRTALAQLSHGRIGGQVKIDLLTDEFQNAFYAAAHRNGAREEADVKLVCVSPPQNGTWVDFRLETPPKHGHWVQYNIRAKVDEGTATVFKLPAAPEVAGAVTVVAGAEPPPHPPADGAAAGPAAAPAIPAAPANP